MSGYKWRAGDWARYNSGNTAQYIGPKQVADGFFYHTNTKVDLRDCTPVIVRPKRLPKKIRRSELRAWAEKYDIYAQRIAGRNVDAIRRWEVREAGYCAFGDKYESAILALRKALRKAGKFVP